MPATAPARVVRTLRVPAQDVQPGDVVDILGHDRVVTSAPGNDRARWRQRWPELPPHAAIGYTPGPTTAITCFWDELWTVRRTQEVPRG